MFTKSFWDLNEWEESVFGKIVKKVNQKKIFQNKKSKECTKIGGFLAETTDAPAIKKLISFLDISEALIEQIEFHTDWGLKCILSV